MEFNKMEFILQVMLTKRCNLRCTHCYGNFGNTSSAELEFKEWQRVFLEMKELCEDNGFDLTIHFSGGEPLLNKDIFNMIDFCNKKRIKTVLLTNGVLISESIIEKLKAAGLDSCQISLESYKKEVNDSIRGNGTFEYITEAIKEIKYNSKIRVSAGMAIMKSNFSDFEEFAKVCLEKLGTDKVVFHRFVPMGRGSDNEMITWQQHDLFLERVKELKKKYGENKIIYTDPLLFCKVSEMKETGKEEMGGCSAGFSVLSINCEGEVYPCPRLPVSCGNIKDSSVSDIYWDSEVMNKLRDRDNLKGKCGECKLKFQCGGCRAFAHGLNGDFLQEDDLCVINRES